MKNIAARTNKTTWYKKVEQWRVKMISLASSQERRSNWIKSEYMPSMRMYCPCQIKCGLKRSAGCRPVNHDSSETKRQLSAVQSAEKALISLKRSTRGQHGQLWTTELLTLHGRILILIMFTDLVRSLCAAKVALSLYPLLSWWFRLALAELGRKIRRQLSLL